jgi:2-desacetyl-2-hydroxyethyl bacteriochlorophyllide A dehydrogenase
MVKQAVTHVPFINSHRVDKQSSKVYLRFVFIAKTLNLERNMKRKVLYFDSPKRVSIKEEALAEPGPDQVLVQTLISAISAGTEMLFYRGEVSEDMLLDETIPSLAKKLEYPLKYGYAAVGKVMEVGRDVSDDWKDQLIFAFNPHESHFVISAKEVIRMPQSLSPEDSVFLPNMETAVSLLMDGRPLIGEQGVVFGQGVVGLLTTALFSRIPLTRLITLDGYPKRREKSIALGAHMSLDPTSPEVQQMLYDSLRSESGYEGADLVYELSGNVQALNQAIAITGFNGRVVIGSWYGKKQARLDLGGRFHRSQITMIASQVSTIAPRFRGRWTKSRRLQVALRMIEKVKPASLITHRFHLDQAAEAYQLLDKNPGETMQVVLTYE